MILDRTTTLAAPARHESVNATLGMPCRTWARRALGAPLSLRLRGEGVDRPEVDVAVAAVFTDLRHADLAFSRYRRGSILNRYNRGEIGREDCPASVRAVLALCEQARERTDGYFEADLPCSAGGSEFDPSGLVYLMTSTTSSASAGRS
jgi:thiamine biosynthesis lipoprotein